jgi:hypothetical protein
MNTAAKVPSPVNAASNVPAMIDQQPMISMIERAARDPTIDIEKLERLIALQEKAQLRQSEQAFNGAMSSAQSEMGPIAADSNNPQTKSRYASYFALDKSLRPIYAKHGFALSFGTGETTQEQYIRVICYVSHRDGFTRTYHVDMPADGKGAKGGDVMTKTHAVGSGMTYGQRYLLKMIFNIAVGSDDDGNAASPRVPSPSEAAPVVPKYDEPREITPEANDTFQLWEGRYMAALQGAKTVAELIKWDQLNDVPLGTISNKAPAIYSRIMNQFEALKAKLEPDPISTGTKTQETPKADARPAGYPDPSREPDAFLDFCGKRMERINDAEELELIFREEIDPASDGIMKPDYDALQAMLAFHQKRLGAD